MISEKELFDRLTNLIKQQLILVEDIKQLKKDAKFNKKTNPGGIDKTQIPYIAEAAKLQAKRAFEEYAGKNYAVIVKFKELSGYDE